MAVLQPTANNFLTLIEGPYWDSARRRHLYKFQCVCGRIVILRPYRAKLAKSCGCRNKFPFHKGNYRHGFSPGKSRTPEYTAYNNARLRCSDPKQPFWKDYGGRGIEFRFNSFIEFINHVGPKPSPDHSLDRIDTNGHYEEGNVRWATLAEQATNKRNSKYIAIDGVVHTQSQWARIAGIADRTINDRLKHGYCIRCAVFAPVEFRHGKPCSHPETPGNRVWRLRK